MSIVRQKENSARKLFVPSGFESDKAILYFVGAG